MEQVLTRPTRSQYQRFALLQILDVATTYFGFSIGCCEINPALCHFFPAFGPVMGLWIGKLMTVCGILMFMAFRSSANTRNGWTAVNRAFTALIAWNVLMIGLTFVLSK